MSNLSTADPIFLFQKLDDNHGNKLVIRHNLKILRATIEVTRMVSYSQHGPKCSLQFIKNIGWRFKTQEPQNHKIDAVPNCRPHRLVEGNFGRDNPPILERKKSLETKSKGFQPFTENQQISQPTKYEPQLSPHKIGSNNEKGIRGE